MATTAGRRAAAAPSGRARHAIGAASADSKRDRAERHAASNGGDVTSGAAVAAAAPAAAEDSVRTATVRRAEAALPRGVTLAVT